VTRVVWVELRRAWARRLVWFFLLASVGAVTAISLSLFATHEKAAPRTETATASSPDGGSAVVVARDRRFRSDTRSAGVLDATSSVFLALAAVVGASLAGAEYRYGSLTTLLTWEPRRIRVIVAKLVAAASVGAGLYLLLHAAIALSLVPVATYRGTLQGADAAFARDVAGFILRGAALSAGLAALGVCLATLGRNTSAALGALFVYLIGVEGILSARVPEWRRWFLVENIARFLTARHQPAIPLDRSLVATGSLLQAYHAGSALVTAAVFRRRDVT
jgi:hypothetical protein